MNNPQNSESGFPVMGVIAGAVALLLAAGFFFLLMPMRGGVIIPPGAPLPVAPAVPPPLPILVAPASPPVAPLSVLQARELLQLKHKALGQLENDRYTEASELLQQIATTVPHDPLGVRNLLVAHILNPGTSAAENERAEAAGEQLLKLAPNSAVTQVLLGRMALKNQKSEEALSRFRQAAKIEPDRASHWFEIYDALRNSGLEDPNQEGLKAVKEAIRLAPRNLWGLLECLGAQAQAQDPEIVKTLDAAAPQILKLRDAILHVLRGLDIGQIVTEAQTAAAVLRDPTQKPNWPAISTAVRKLQNVLRPRPQSQSDKSRIQPHPLELVLFEFQPGTLPKEGLESSESHPAIPVTFEPLSAALGDGELTDVLVQDVDLDSRPEILVARPKKLEILRQSGTELKFEVSQTLELPAGFTKIVACDLDLDQAPVISSPQPMTPSRPGDGTTVCHKADADLILYGPAGIGIWINTTDAEGQRTFKRAEMTGLDDVREVRTLAVGDYDHDGDLDIVAGLPEQLTLFVNREGFQFQSGDKLAQLPEACRAVQIIPVDWDHDVDLDFLVLGTSGTEEAAATRYLGYLENLLHGELRWQPAAEGWATELPAGVQSGLVLDADANATWDLLLSHSAGLSLVLSKPSLGKAGNVLRVVKIRDSALNSVQIADFDNDGYLDITGVEKEQQRWWRGGPEGKFELSPVATAAIFQGEMFPLAQAADFDRDGDLESLIAGNTSSYLLVNQGGNQNHWLDVRLRALQDKGEAIGLSKRVNHQGIGSLVELRSGAFYQPQIVRSDVVHFGLGSRATADAVRILWTNGVPQVILQPQGDREICEEQAPKGSCPFVYVWNGERYEFFTDLLWNAPIGLQFAQGVIAQPREWEYLKIPGERLHLQNGQHVLQITEELWEASYFDQIELLAVDHPAEVEIFTNEKVGPPEIAQHKIHTVRQRRVPVSARDQAGRDVLPALLSEDDDDYTRCYDRKLAQGLTTEHSIELDLGKLDDPKQITLFLTGWMYPTETSINVSLSQNSIYPLHRPPALWVPDAQGEWRQIRPFMGFPGGKTKTIAIDLSDVFANGDHRLRIVTNMEFYWGGAFFTVDEAPAEVRTHTLPLVSAELHYRGRSTHRWPSGNGPDFYDYSTTIRDPQWPPMQGYFTRYGDVKELLETIDDRLLVIGSGDEATVKFAEPETPVPSGWKRDYVLHNVGWDKDADLNTVFGQTVEPLPFVKMSQYPLPAGEEAPDSPAFRDYLRKYQTRMQQSRKFWTKLRDGDL